MLKELHKEIEEKKNEYELEAKVKTRIANNLKDEIELKDTLITKNKEEISLLTSENERLKS